MKSKIILLTLSLVLLVSTSINADVPDEITYQGRLLYNGNPVTSATSIVFRLFQASSGGSAVWTETHGLVTPDSNGIYTEVLGVTTAIPDDYDALWLELVVSGNTLTPRKKLTSALFVLRAGTLLNLNVSSKIGIGTTSPVFDVDLWKNAPGNVTHRIRNDNVNGIAQLNLFINGNGSGDPRIQFDVSGGVAYSLGVDNDDSNKFKFSVGNGLGGLDALTIQSNGDVGIGTTSPGAKLDVNGAINGFGIAPIGVIMAWHKSFGSTPSLPNGWIECNGQLLNDSASPYDGQIMPDLNNKRDANYSAGSFLRGNTTSGAWQHATTFDDEDHWGHQMGYSNSDGTEMTWTATKFEGNNGTATATRIRVRPVNMSVVWIMRVK